MGLLVKHRCDALWFSRVAARQCLVLGRVAKCLVWACLGGSGAALAQWPAPAETEAQDLPPPTTTSAYTLHPGAGGVPGPDGLRSWEDPSVRILARTQSLALNFSLVSQDEVWAAWSADTAAASAAGLGARLPTQSMPLGSEPVMRLWIPLADHGQRLRLTHAFVNLTRPGYVGGDLQVRPSAGVVMHLGGGPTYLQQLSLGSVFRLNTGQGSQLALRLRGGRLGLQYRLQFNL